MKRNRKEKIKNATLTNNKDDNNDSPKLTVQDCDSDNDLFSTCNHENSRCKNDNDNNRQNKEQYTELSIAHDNKEQQRTVTNDNRKNQKLLDVPIKSKKDNITESSLVSLEMTESYQQLETSTSTGTKFRSNANEGGFLLTNEELQLDHTFTQSNLETKSKTTNTKNKAKQFQKQLFQEEKCKEYSTKPTMDRDNLGFCLVCDKSGDLICCDICPSSFHLKCIDMKKQDSVGTFSWHREKCQSCQKKRSEGIMKIDTSHDIINKVPAPLKISCRNYRNKKSILCKIHEVVIFLINDEFGRYISAQIDTSIYNQIIKNPKHLTTIAMNLINGNYLKDAPLDRSAKDTAMKMINSNYLQDAPSPIYKKDITVYDSNENTFDKIILAVLHDIEKVW